MSNGLNQYTSAGSASFTYDANGNLTSDGSTTFVYDSQNRLTSSTANGVTTWFNYGPLGRLYQIYNGTEIRRFVYAPDDSGTPEPIAEYDGNDRITQLYAWGAGPNEPLIWWDGAAGFAQRNLQADERGSIVAVTDTGGNPVNINRYDEYGIPASGNAGPFQYTGQMWLPEVGLYYYKNRFYSPTSGRFLQTDPIANGLNVYFSNSLFDEHDRRKIDQSPNLFDGEGVDMRQSWITIATDVKIFDPSAPNKSAPDAIHNTDSPNLYTYALNDPINLADPTGLAPKSPGPNCNLDANNRDGSVCGGSDSSFKSRDRVNDNRDTGPSICGLGNALEWVGTSALDAAPIVFIIGAATGPGEGVAAPVSGGLAGAGALAHFAGSLIRRSGQCG